MAQDDEILQRMMANNRAWKAAVDRDDPGFFARMAQHHAPRVLWIGCSDSRVPGNESIGIMPGEIFYHRSVANQLQMADFNVAGDFNVTPDHVEYPKITAAGLIDACSRMSGETFPGEGRIDHVFVTPDAGTPASDHWPVFVELALWRTRFDRFRRFQTAFLAGRRAKSLISPHFPAVGLHDKRPKTELNGEKTAFPTAAISELLVRNFKRPGVYAHARRAPIMGNGFAEFRAFAGPVAGAIAHRGSAHGGLPTERCG